MPAPAHYRVTFSGFFGDSDAAVDDIWATGFAYAVPGGSAVLSTDLAGLGGLAQGMRSVWATHVLPGLHNGTRLRRVRVAAVGADGLTLRTATGQYAHADEETPGQGTATTGRMPPQISLAITLKSLFEGSTGRGRMFIPGPALDLDAGGTLSTTNQTAWANRMESFFNGINGITTAGFTGHRIVVASGGSALKGLAPSNHEVRDVLVGQVADTQRRRRNAISENYATRTLAPAA